MMICMTDFLMLAHINMVKSEGAAMLSAMVASQEVRASGWHSVRSSGSQQGKGALTRRETIGLHSACDALHHAKTLEFAGRQHS